MQKFVILVSLDHCLRVAQMKTALIQWNLDIKCLKKCWLKISTGTNCQWRARFKSRSMCLNIWILIALGEKKWNATCQSMLVPDGIELLKYHWSKNSTTTRLICGALDVLFSNFFSMFIKIRILSSKTSSKSVTCFKVVLAFLCHLAKIKTQIMMAVNKRKSTWSAILIKSKSSWEVSVSKMKMTWVFSPVLTQFSMYVSWSHQKFKRRIRLMKKPPK